MTDVAFRVSVTQDMVHEAVVEHLKSSLAFKKLVEQAVREEVKVQGPGNPRIQQVIQEVRDHLDRYPGLASDIGLQDAVGTAIFNYLQKKI